MLKFYLTIKYNITNMAKKTKNLFKDSKLLVSISHGLCNGEGKLISISKDNKHCSLIALTNM
jgi:hypothetical protein